MRCSEIITYLHLSCISFNISRQYFNGMDTYSGGNIKSHFNSDPYRFDSDVLQGGIVEQEDCRQIVLNSIRSWLDLLFRNGIFSTYS